MGTAVTYSQEFYIYHQDQSQSSAEELLPLVLDLVHPRSMVDVGCGVGAWLAVARARGISDILGIDGEWVNPEMLRIPAGCFLGRDLSRPLDVGRQFDLVLSLEVAEHLPPDRADTFVDSLVALGPVILFSAAVPLQGGTAHVNEQWPEYWAQRFAARGYTAVDCLRRRVWNNPRVDFWYAQNALLYVKAELLDTMACSAHDFAGDCPCAMVHRDLYLKIAQKFDRAKAAADPANIPLRKAVLILLMVSRRVIMGRLAGRRN